MALGPVVPKDSAEVLVTVEAEDVFDVEASLPRITAPTLVVGGAHDAGYSREMFEATARGIPDGRVHIIEGKGHATVGTATTMHLALGFLLAERAVATPGVLCPETALPFERFFGELERRGIRVAFSEQGQLDD